MKTRSVFLSLLFGVTAFWSAFAADPKAQLREGLFEEEVNRDLAKAMQHYRSLIEGFDAQRQFAATAIYRLGECYRKQGQTNEAVSHYQRVVREFSDQSNIVASASVHLRSLNRKPATGIANSDSPFESLDKVFKDMAEIGKELAKIQAAEDFMANMSGTESPDTINSALQDVGMSNLLAQLEKIIPWAERSKYRESDDDTQLQAMLGEAKYRQIESILMQMEARSDAIGAENTQRKDLLELKSETLQESLPLVQAMMVSRINSSAATNAPGGLSSRQVGLQESASEFTAISQMVKDSPDLLNAPYKGKSSPLEYVISKGLAPVAQFLLERGADRSGKTRGGKSYLSIAVDTGNLAVTKLLMSRRDGIDQADLNEALGIAAAKGFIELARYLIEQKADVNAKIKASPSPRSRLTGVYSSLGSPLADAVGNGQLKAAQLMLAAGADPNMEGAMGLSPIHVATSKRYLNVPASLQALIDGGADVNARASAADWAQRAALHMAVILGRHAAVEVLLEAGAIPNARDAKDATPLHYAAEQADVKMVAQLLAKQADPNLAGSIQGWEHDPAPPLANVMYQSESSEGLEIAKQLLKAGATADIGMPTGKSKSLLGYMIKANRLQFANLLLDYGANPDFAREDYTLLHAVDQQRGAIIHRLIEAGADVNQSLDGFTPLFAALSRRDTNTISALLKAKADPNLSRKGGQTPLDYVNYSLRPISGPRINSQHRDKYRPIFETVRQMLLEAGASYIAGDSQAITLIRKSNGVRWPILRKYDHPLSDFRLLEVLALAYYSGRAPVDLGFPAWDKIQIHRPKGDGYETTRINAVDLIAATNSTDVALQWGDIVEIPEEPHRLGEEWVLSHKLRSKLGNRQGRRVTVDDGRNRVAKTLYPLSPDLARIRSVLKSSTGIEAFSMTDEAGFGGEIRRDAWPSCWLRDVIGSLDNLMTYHDLTRVTVLRPGKEGQKSRKFVFDMSPIKPTPGRISMGGIEASAIKDKGLWLRDGDFVIIPNGREQRTGGIPGAVDAEGNPVNPR